MTAVAQGLRRSSSSSRSSPRASMAGAIWASVASSICSRWARPSSVSCAVLHEAGLGEAGLGGVELGVAPGPGAHVGAGRHAPVELGEQPDLGGVVAGGHPGGDVAVAAELAELVAEPEQVAERRAGQALGEVAGEERPAPRLERGDGAGEELVGAVDRRRAPARGCARAGRPPRRGARRRWSAASVSVQPKVTAGTTTSALNTPKAAATSSPGTWPSAEPRLVK